MTRRPARLLPAAGLALALLAGCTAPSTPAAHTTGRAAPTRHPGTSRATTAAQEPRHSGATALGELDRLPVKGRAPLTGYDRDRFGAAWLDADRNGCDSRDDILNRDLSHRAYEPGTHDCVVDSGVLADPYTATRIAFVKGDGDLVDIDHVVALGNAWATGAFGWGIRERAALANDPMNLLAVDASANRQKGDGDAATWLPGNKPYRCAYVARQIAVKAKYRLWVTAPEKAAMQRVLARCPGQRAVQDSGAPVLAPLNLSDPGPSAPATGQAGASGGGSVYYANCDAARAAGAAPVHRGDPGYAPHLDRDGDGVGCE